MSPQKLIRTSALITAACVLSCPAFGQGRGGAGAGGTSTGSGAGSTTTTPGATTTTPTTTTTRPTVTTPTQQTPQQNMPPQPIFITGQVLLEDGAPAANVVIERVCSGSPHSEGYTDSRGYFSIRLGEQNNGVMHDASEDMTGFGRASAADPFGGAASSSPAMGRMMSENRFFDCDLRARLAGYRSQSVSLANRRSMDPPDIGVILLHRLGQSEGATVSATSLAAPKDARKAFEKGVDALKKRKPDDAMKDFQKAVGVYPKFAAAWNELGRLQAAKGDSEKARASFEAAAQADSRFVPPVLEMAMLEWKAERWQRAAELTDKVIRLDAFDYPQAHFLNALSNYYLKNLEAAEKSAREATRLDTRKQYLASRRLLGVILAQKADYTGAAEQLKAYLQLAPKASDAATVRNQLSQLEKVLAAKQ